MRVISSPFNHSGTELIYQTDSPNNNVYGFGGFKPGWLPTETFDAGDYIGCLHGISLCLSLIEDHKRSHEAIEDDGVIHEIVHQLHIPGGRFRSVLGDLNYTGKEVRQKLVKLQEDAQGAYERKLEETYQQNIEPPETFKRYVRQAPEVQQEGGNFKIEFASSLKRVYPSEPVRESVLRGTGNEETRVATDHIEAGRSKYVRTGDTGEVSVYRLQETGEGKPE